MARFNLKGAVLLAVMVLLAGATTSYAQFTGTVTFSATSANPQVREQGITEALGDIQLNAAINSGPAYAVITNTGATPSTLTLSVSFFNTPITNEAISPTPTSVACPAGTTIGAAGFVLGSTGVSVTYRNLSCDTATTTVAWNLVPLVGTSGILNLTFTMAPTAVLTFGDDTTATPTAPTVMQVHGVRANVTAIPAGGTVQGFVNSAPSNVIFLGGFFNPLIVATVQPGLVVALLSTPVIIANCGLTRIPSTATRPITGISSSAGPPPVLQDGVGVLTSTDGGAAATRIRMRLTEGFVGSFTTLAQEVAKSGVEVDNGVQLQILLTSLPTGSAIAVPQRIRVPSTDTALGAGTAGTILTLDLIPPGPAAAGDPLVGVVFTPSGGAVTVTYAVTVAAPILGTPSSVIVPIWLFGGVTTPVATINATARMAPVSTVTGQSATAGIVRFIDKQLPSPAAVVNLTACITDVMYPFVTNRAGFDTGMSVGNLGQDHLGTSRQEGTCTLRYWDGSTTGTTPVKSVDLGNFTPGIVKTVLVSDPTLGSPGFQGYAIATCNFQYAHGFAIVVNGFGQAAAPTLGTAYLGLIFGEPRIAAAHGGAAGTTESLAQ